MQNVDRMRSFVSKSTMQIADGSPFELQSVKVQNADRSPCEFQSVKVQKVDRMRFSF